MDSEIVKVSDAKVQSLGLKFSFSTEGDKLIIEAFCSKDNQKYVGEMIANPYVDLQDIKQLLNEGQFKTLLKNEEILKIKAGAVPIELLPKEKSEIKELKEALSKSVDKQQQMQAIIDLQNAQLNTHENMIKDLKTTVEELKSSPKVTTLTIQEIKGEFSQKIKQLEENMKTEISSIKNEQQQFLSSSETQRKMEIFSVQLTKIKDEVKKINDNVLIQRVNIDELKKQVKQSTDNLKRQITDLTKITQNQSIVIDQLQKSLKNQIQENKRIIDDHEERLKRLTDGYQTKLKSIVEGQNQKIKVELKEIKSKIQKLNPLIEKIEQEQKQKQEEQKRKMIELFKWSQQLKSQKIKINGNVVNLFIQQNVFSYWKFCLLNASFSNTLKTKQSWAIKINKMTSRTRLGVCLKSKIINYNFNGKNINWRETGHGFYMIGSGGFCSSHSQKEFNNVQKSFKFGVNDVIYVEYDPIDLKLRFSKNKVEYFELSIIAPPQNDAYHPFVGLGGQNSSVELLPPQQLN